MPDICSKILGLWAALLLEDERTVRRGFGKMKTARFRLTTLTPVHVGAGAKYGPLEYYIRDNRLCRVDFYRLCSDPGFTKYRDRIIKSALEMRKERIDQLAPDLAERFQLYSIDQAGLSGEYPDVSEHIKTGMRPYIPGSSLKGSILTALVYDYFKNNKGELDTLRREMYSGRGRRFRIGRKIIENTIGSLTGSDAGTGDGKRGFARWIRISDPETVPIEKLFAGKVIVCPSRQSGPRIAMEMLKPGTDFEYEIEPFGDIDLNGLIAKVDEFYRLVLREENGWRKRQGLSLLGFGEGGDGSALVRVGTGSSKLATSLLLLLDEAHPKTRKLVIPGLPPAVQEKSPMGWARLQRVG